MFIKESIDSALKEEFYEQQENKGFRERKRRKRGKR